MFSQRVYFKVYVVATTDLHMCIQHTTIVLKTACISWFQLIHSNEVPVTH